MRQPLNLVEMYGDKYQIVLDEASYEPGGKQNLWYKMILCKYGDIYPYSDKLLGYHCVGAKVRMRLHRDHPELEVRQWSDDGECVFLFRPDQFDMVAKYAKPRLGRQLSTKHKEKLLRSGLRSRFSSKDHGSQSSSERQEAREKV